MRKAVSPLVAAVLLIAVTMTLAAILSMWATGFITGRTKEWEEKSPAGECAFANFKIYSCRYNAADNTFRVILENLRDVELKNITAFVFYDNDTVSFPSSLQNLPGGQIQTYTIPGVSPNYLELTVKTHCPDARQADDCR